MSSNRQNETSADSPAGQWKRERFLVYCLAQTGPDGGDPVLENAMEVTVRPGRQFSWREAEELAARIADFLNREGPFYGKD
jgi:hypothetical protein